MNAKPSVWSTCSWGPRATPGKVDETYIIVGQRSLSSSSCRKVSMSQPRWSWKNLRARITTPSISPSTYFKPWSSSATNDLLSSLESRMFSDKLIGEAMLDPEFAMATCKKRFVDTSILSEPDDNGKLFHGNPALRSARRSRRQDRRQQERAARWTTHRIRRHRQRVTLQRRYDLLAN